MDLGRSTESHGEINCTPEMKNDDVTFTKNQMARADIYCFSYIHGILTGRNSNVIIYNIKY